MSVGSQTVDGRIRNVDIESNTTFLQVEMINAKACMFEANGRKNDFRNDVIIGGE